MMSFKLVYLKDYSITFITIVSHKDLKWEFNLTGGDGVIHTTAL